MLRRIMVLVVLLMAGLSAGAAAQEASPPAGGPPESFELAPGVTADQVVFVEGQEGPSLYRLTFAPGVTYPVAPSPSLEIAYVEAGTLILQMEGPVIIGKVGTPDAAGELVEAGTEITLSAGQYVVLQPGVAGEVRNDGQDAATVSVAGVNVGDMPTSGAATPAG